MKWTGAIFLLPFAAIADGHPDDVRTLRARAGAPPALARILLDDKKVAACELHPHSAVPLDTFDVNSFGEPTRNHGRVQDLISLANILSPALERRPPEALKRLRRPGAPAGLVPAHDTTVVGAVKALVEAEYRQLKKEQAGADRAYTAIPADPITFEQIKYRVRTADAYRRVDDLPYERWKTLYSLTGKLGGELFELEEAGAKAEVIEKKRKELEVAAEEQEHWNNVRNDWSQTVERAIEDPEARPAFLEQYPDFKDWFKARQADLAKAELAREREALSRRYRNLASIQLRELALLQSFVEGFPEVKLVVTVAPKGLGYHFLRFPKRSEALAQTGRIFFRAAPNTTDETGVFHDAEKAFGVRPEAVRWMKCADPVFALSKEEEVLQQSADQEGFVPLDR